MISSLFFSFTFFSFLFLAPTFPFFLCSHSRFSFSSYSSYFISSHIPSFCISHLSSFIPLPPFFYLSLVSPTMSVMLFNPYPSEYPYLILVFAYPSILASSGHPKLSDVLSLLPSASFSFPFLFMPFLSSSDSSIFCLSFSPFFSFPTHPQVI